MATDAGDRPGTPEYDRAFSEWWNGDGYNVPPCHSLLELSRSTWQAAVAWAIAGERERAATIAEDRYSSIGLAGGAWKHYIVAGNAIAAAIRSDPDAPGGEVGR